MHINLLEGRAYRLPVGQTEWMEIMDSTDSRYAPLVQAAGDLDIQARIAELAPRWNEVAIARAGMSS